MFHPRSSTIVGLILGLCLPAMAAAADYESGFIQIQLNPSVPIAAVNVRFGTTTADSLPPLYLLGVPDGTDPLALIAVMSAAPDSFPCAELAYRTETAEGVRQMVVSAVGETIEGYFEQNLAERLHLDSMHEASRGEGTLVAILDTGVAATHEVLAGAITGDGYDFVDDDDDPSETTNGLDDDEDGWIDEGAGHGTLVAGLVHLVAPEARILPIRVLDDEGRGSTFLLAKGIRYAVAQGADVINMSLGLTDRSGVVAHELAQAYLASAAMVSAAGNLGVDSVQYFPACDMKVVMVAALDSLDVKADFSNYHAKVELSAPGVGLLGPYHDGGYAIGSGTSFATALVSGHCAILCDLLPGISGEQIQQLASASTVDIYSIDDNDDYFPKLGTGRIDGLALLDAAGALAGVEERPFTSGLRIFPNPARGDAEMRFVLENEAPAAAGRLLLHDIGGRVLRSFALTERSRGVSWDGRDAGGNLVPAGVYFLRFSGAGETARSMAVILIR